MLFVTGYAENAVLNHGHLERGMQVVTKPFSSETLACRVKDLIGGAAAVRQLSRSDSNTAMPRWNATWRLNSNDRGTWLTANDALN